MHRSNGSQRAAVVLAAVLAAIAAPRSAHADNKDPTPEEIAAARDLAREGVKAARDGRCADAVPKLERARELYEAPVIPAVALGDCLIKIGKVVQGTEILQIVARANLGPKPEKFNVVAKENARRLLEQALPKIGKLLVAVDGPAGIEVSVTIDKQALPKSLIGIGRPSDPGEHVVEATGPGLLPSSQTVTLAEGQELSVSLVVKLDPAAIKPAERPLAVATDRPPRSKVPGIVLLGIGGAGIASGAVTGIMALGTRSTLNTECPNRQCGPSASSDLSSLKTLSWVSTIGFAAGAAAAGVGVILLVRSTSDPSKTGRLTLTPSIGFGNVGLSGEF